MMIMKRYCDYDYDNNCIILFDAVDAEKPTDELNICWISSNSGDNNNNTNNISKNNVKNTNVSNSKVEIKKKVPLYQYLQTQHSKKMKLQKQLLMKQAVNNYNYQILNNNNNINYHNNMNYFMNYHLMCNPSFVQ
eukprot:82801_1